MTWRDCISVLPCRGEICLRTSHGRWTLAEVDRVVDYFRQRKPCLFLNGRILGALSERNASRGVALKDHKIEFDHFPATFLPDEPNWAEDPFHDSNWQWSFHCLTVIRYLLAAHRKRGDSSCLERAEALLFSWMRHNYSPTPPSRYSWNDHSTALRLENLLYYLEYARHRGITPKGMTALLEAVHSHAMVLVDGEFYNEHTNHGLDQSCILYLAGAAFPEFEEASGWREIGQARIRSELAFAFTSEGVHVENSPSYHMILLRRLLEIDAMLRNYEGHGVGPGLDDLLEEAFRFAAYVIKPDGKLPTVGDSESVTVKDTANFRAAGGVRGYEEFKFSVSQGCQGIAPAALHFAWPKSGYAILRGGWETLGFADSFYLLFKAGFLSSYHKHDDDLSFVLSNKGEDWIIDSGLYRHAAKDAFRQYMLAPWAHNTVTVDHLLMSRGKSHIGNSQIDHFVSDALTGAATIKGSHRLYPGLNVERELAYRRPGSFTIMDRVISEDGNERTFRILFHVPIDKEITISDRSVLVRSSRTGQELNLRVLTGDVRHVYAVSGQETPRLQGWTSLSYGERVASTCICFEGSGTEWRSKIELAFPGCAQRTE
jgi:hypothetical protein